MTNPKHEAKALTLPERLDAQLDELVAEAAHLTPGPNITTYRSIALDLLQQLDAKDAQIKDMERARDDWKARHESLDRQGYAVSRECDVLRDQLASTRAPLEKAEAALRAIASTEWWYDHDAVEAASSMKALAEETLKGLP